MFPGGGSTKGGAGYQFPTVGGRPKRTGGIAATKTTSRPREICGHETEARPSRPGLTLLPRQWRQRFARANHAVIAAPILLRCMTGILRSTGGAHFTGRSRVVWPPEERAEAAARAHRRSDEPIATSAFCRLRGRARTLCFRIDSLPCKWVLCER